MKKSDVKRVSTREKCSPEAAGIVAKQATKKPLASRLVVQVVGDKLPHSLTEKSMRSKENRIPQLAADAVKQARANTLNSGRSVLEVKDGQLVETLPDGSVNVIRTLTPPTKVTPGQKLIRKIK